MAADLDFPARGDGATGFDAVAAGGFALFLGSHMRFDYGTGGSGRSGGWFGGYGVVAVCLFGLGWMGVDSFLKSVTGFWESQEWNTDFHGFRTDGHG